LDFATGVKSAWSRYAQFNGRSCRAEFWYFRLSVSGGNLLITLVSNLIGVSGSPIAMFVMASISLIFALAVIIPDLSVSCRRLHDRDRSGWWVLLILIPIIGWIILLIWVCQPGQRGSNRFGPDPLGPPPNVADLFS